MVTEENVIDILETLNVEDVVSEEEVLEMLQERWKGEPERQMQYSQFKEILFDLLVYTKKIPFSKLVHQYYSLPVDRIQKLYNMLIDEFSHGIKSEVKDFFL